jgi:integrase/recombinase XerD
MKDEIIREILYAMNGKLNAEQLDELKMILYMKLNDCEVSKKQAAIVVCDDSTMMILKKFLTAKVVERKSDKTVRYYKGVLQRFLVYVQKRIEDIDTDDIRKYLYIYRQNCNISKTTMDNIRRVLSSFFRWLVRNRYIIFNPMDLIEKIKPDQTIKDCFTDEEIVTMRDNCTNLRDLALVDFLNASMVRVGELVRLNRDDIDLSGRECVVFGKGSKERPVYIDGNAKVHLLEYLSSRKDNNPALFVSNKAPYNRLTIGGVQDALKRLGVRSGVTKVHPHRFRRTGATRHLNKGMPIEQVKELLGHAKIDTTMIYLTVNKNIVKSNYQRLAN